MGIYLIAGMLISKHGDKVKAFFESLWPFVVMPLLGLYLSMYLGDKIYFYDIPEKHLLSNGDIMTYFLRQVCGITWSLWFIWLFRRFYKKYDIFCYFGTLTLGIYIIHAYMLHIVRYIYKTFDYSQYSRFEAILIALLPAVILSSLSIALIHLFKRRKATKELLLGEY